LQEYAWPGNVRELANLCERLAIMRAGQTVRATDLTALLSPRPAPQPDEPELSLSARVDAFERRIIARSLHETGGSVAEAARRLQTDRPNLYRRMRRLGIEK
jgi:DNA-binding NtrC family response regulator